MKVFWFGKLRVYDTDHLAQPPGYITNIIKVGRMKLIDYQAVRFTLNKFFKSFSLPGQIDGAEFNISLPRIQENSILKYWA